MNQELTKAKAQAVRVIHMTERALKKHINLVKKRNRVTSVVAMVERLRGDLLGDDPKRLREDIKRLNELTRGFADYALRPKKPHA